MYRPTETARFAGIRPMAPSGLITTAAPSLALWPGRLPRGRSPRLFGAIPVHEFEGHDVDPAYDVRPVEDSRRPPIRAERLAGLGLVIPNPAYLALAASGASQEPEPAEPEPAGLFGTSTPYLVLAALAAVALGMMLKR